MKIPYFNRDNFASQLSTDETPLAKGAKESLVTEDGGGCPPPLSVHQGVCRRHGQQPDAKLSFVWSGVWGQEGLPGALQTESGWALGYTRRSCEHSSRTDTVPTTFL